MPSPLIDFSLPAWPREAFPFEPAHGFFRRLAAANAQISVRTLGAYVGVNGRNFDREELLEFCSRFPSINIENLRRFTPRAEGPLVAMNGEFISHNKDYTPYHPRVCPSCLNEAYYYRNWFDLPAVGFCPIHGEALCDLNAGERMAWWQASLGQPLTLRCSTFSSAEGQRSLDWERYALGRMGVVERHLNPVLDAFSLADVIAGCVLLGAGQIANTASSAERRAVPRHDVAAAGFKILRRGKEGVRDFFVAKAEHASESGGWRGATIDGSFGWVAAAVKRNLPSAIGDLCRSGLDAAVDQLSLYSRNSRLDPTAQPACHLTLTDLALKTGLSRRNVRLIAYKMGLVHPARTGSQTYWFAPAQIEAFETLIEDLIGRNEAAEHLGLPRKAFDALLVRVDLQPYVRMGGSDPAADRFLGSEISNFLCLIKRQAVLVDQPGLSFDEFCRLSKCSPSDIAWAVVQGRQNITRVGEGGFAGMELPLADVKTKSANGPRPRQSSRYPGISFADAASRLGVAPAAIPGLVEAGHLEVQNEAVGRFCRITPTSLADFDAQYAPLGAYARAFNLSPQRVSADFRAAGVRILDREGRQKVAWADRTSVISALGERWDLKKPLDAFSSAVWDAFRRQLSAIGSPNRLVDAVSTSARLRSGSGFVLLQISIQPAEKSLAVTARADRKSSPAWFGLLNAHKTTIHETWPGASLSCGPDSIEFAQTHSVGSEELAGWLNNTVSEVEQLATNLRMLRLMKGSES